ncbi:MAG TPA: YggS family pyridoxal phosphate-dependent enzyme [Actinomycetota bacterium]
MHPDRATIEANVAAVREHLARACERSGRDPSSVTLVAAAKTQPLARVTAVVEAGVACVGHNYVRELRVQHDQVSGARWHYIGVLQTGTAHHVAGLADVVETVAGGRATERVARRAAQAGRTVDVLIEVDFTERRTGVTSDQVHAVADAVARLDGLRLRGLMTVPPAGRTADDARPWFRRLRELRDALAQNHADMVDLSMGMSLDYEAAVEEGATMVRIGTALFGPRQATGTPHDPA